MLTSQIYDFYYNNYRNINILIYNILQSYFSTAIFCFWSSKQIWLISLKILGQMNNINEYFLNRRTVRQYSQREVSQELLTSLIEQAAHAPTTGNMQLYSVIVTRSDNGKRALAPTHFNQPAVLGASVILTFCVDFNRFKLWCNANDATPGFDNFQSFMSAVLDTALFAQQFNTIAEMNGLGCCYLGTTTYNAPQIAKLLELPKNVVPLTSITVGYPEGEPTISDRIPVAGIIHNETYHDYTIDDIRHIYSEKEAREDSKKLIAENGKRTLAQVFTDVRYPRNNNELFSRIYIDFIKEQGYEI